MQGMMMELQGGERIPGHRCGETEPPGGGGGGGRTGSKALAGGQGAAAPLSLLPPAQQSSPRRVTMSPKGKAPLPVPRGGGGGGKVGGQPHCPPPGHIPTRCKAGTPLQEEKADEARVHCRPPPPPHLATLPYLRDVARRFPGNGNGIPNTSGRVSLPPLRCHPPFPG